MFSELIRPWIHTNRNHFLSSPKNKSRTVLILLLGVTVCAVLFWGSYRVLSYFHAQDELGIILSLKIFQMVWLLLFAMLIFSAMVTAISTFYLSEDNEILLAAPVLPREILRIRYITTTLATSWMVVIFSLPVFASYGLVFNSGPLYWPLVLLVLPSVTLTCSGAAILFTIVLIYLFPARRTKDIILYLSLCFGIFLYLVFRLIQPENLVNPEQYGHFIEYFNAISRPSGPWIPAGWAAKMLSSYLLDRVVDPLLLGLLLTTPMVLFFLCEYAMDLFFMAGFSKSQESFGGHRRFRRIGRLLPHNRLSWILRKELRHFTRDSTEWSQLFMIGALIVVYVYNFKALPLERSPLPTVYISNLIAFANIGLSGFLAASLATRFVYPAIGSEKGAFYLIHASPISLPTFLLYKYIFYFVPFTLLTTILVVSSNYFLNISGPMWWISLLTALLITWTVIGFGLGFGALFADFRSVNRASAMGPGAILFLFCAVLFALIVLALGFAPTYKTIRAWSRLGSIPLLHLLLLIIWQTGTALIAFLLNVLLWRAGIRRLRG